MRRFLATSLLALVALPASAQRYGGGGVTMHQAVIPWEVPGQLGPNAMGCVGGIGYGVSRGKRRGGEGHFCGGPYANMAMGGAHFGLQSKRGGVWLTGYNTVGAGWIGVHGVDSGRFDGAFVYTRPAFGAGVGLGRFAGLEGNVFAMLPLNVLGVAGRDIDPQFSFPHVGLQATLLFGDFSRQRDQPKPPKVKYSAPPPPPPPRAAPPAPPARPAAPVPPAAPAAPQGPLRPGDLPPANGGEPAPAPPPPPSDDRPLAIPG